MMGSHETSIIHKVVTVRCNNPICGFIGNYHNTTIESVKATRNFMSKTPLVSVNDCNHLDYSIEVSKN